MLREASGALSERPPTTSGMLASSFARRCSTTPTQAASSCSAPAGGAVARDPIGLFDEVTANPSAECGLGRGDEVDRLDPAARPMSEDEAGLLSTAWCRCTRAGPEGVSICLGAKRDYLGFRAGCVGS